MVAMLPLLLCRQNQRLIRALTSIVLPAAEDAADQVMVSHDRFAIYRATVLEATRDGGGVIDGSKYTTGAEVPLLMHNN
jgi:hypothetical protein